MNGYRGLSWGRIVVGLLLIVVGGGWLLQTAGILDFPLRALAPLALIVIGVGLVAASRRGSYPGLIVAGAVLTVLLAVGSDEGRWMSWRSDDEMPERFVGVPDGPPRVRVPRSADDLRPYRISAGQLTINLTRLELEDRTYDVNARVGAGQLRVIVPEGVPVRVEARSGVGNVDVLGEERDSGPGSEVDFESDDYDEARPRFDLELRVGVGSIRVTERPPRAPVLRMDRDREATFGLWPLSGSWIAG